MERLISYRKTTCTPRSVRRYLPPFMNHSPVHESGVLRARRVMTMTPGPEAEALWWQAGRIELVGSASEVERAAPRGIPRYDLPDALVTPGFVDGHTHLAMWALNRGRVELAGLRTREEVIARVSSVLPRHGWVIGHGWDANGWSSPPHRLALDAVQPGPVYLDSLDVHAAWLNTAALAAARITRRIALLQVYHRARYRSGGCRAPTAGPRY